MNQKVINLRNPAVYFQTKIVNDDRTLCILEVKINQVR